MKYLAASYAKAIISRLDNTLGELTEGNREHRFVLPRQEANLTLELGTQLEEFILSQEVKISFDFIVGYALGDCWANGTKNERHCFENLQARGWYDKANSLTKYRNRKRNPETEDLLVVVLIGIDLVRDQGSLDDMFRVDTELVWEELLKGNFKPWLRSWLDLSHVAYENDHLEVMDDVLISLVQCSLAGLYDISSFLEHCICDYV
jgi:hypothetical protein